MKPAIDDKINEIRMICQEYGVCRLEVFGSACTAEFEEGRSAIDFLVTFPPDYDYGLWLGRVQDLERALSELLGAKVDLVMSFALRNPLFRIQADKTRQVIYDASDIGKLA